MSDGLTECFEGLDTASHRSTASVRSSESQEYNTYMVEYYANYAAVAKEVARDKLGKTLLDAATSCDPDNLRSGKKKLSAKDLLRGIEYGIRAGKINMHVMNGRRYTDEPVGASQQLVTSNAFRDTLLQDGVDKYIENLDRLLDVVYKMEQKALDDTWFFKQSTKELHNANLDAVRSLRVDLCSFGGEWMLIKAATKTNEELCKTNRRVSGLEASVDNMTEQLQTVAGLEQLLKGEVEKKDQEIESLRHSKELAQAELSQMKENCATGMASNNERIALLEEKIKYCDDVKSNLASELDTVTATHKMFKDLADKKIEDLRGMILVVNNAAEKTITALEKKGFQRNSTESYNPYASPDRRHAKTHTDNVMAVFGLTETLLTQYEITTQKLKSKDEHIEALNKELAAALNTVASVTKERDAAIAEVREKDEIISKQTSCGSPGDMGELQYLYDELKKEYEDIQKKNDELTREHEKLTEIIDNIQRNNTTPKAAPM